MKISILLCTYNRPQLLNLCLDSIISKSMYQPDELLIVNGGSSETTAVIEYWKKRFGNIKHIKTKNVNLATSRNIALPHCTGDIIALTDDDVIVDSDWIEKIKRLHLENPKAGAIGGRIKGANSDSFLDRVADIAIFSCPEEAGYTRTVAGANASYKREVIEKTGKYDESLFRGEDVDYNWRIQKEGYKVYYDPELLVYHRHRTTWRGLFDQVYMYGRAYYLVRSKWKDMYCVYPHGIRNFKDILKLGYFFFGIIFEPLLFIKKIEDRFFKIKAIFILVFLQMVWKSGMIIEGLRNLLNGPGKK